METALKLPNEMKDRAANIDTTSAPVADGLGVHIKMARNLRELNADLIQHFCET